MNPSIARICHRAASIVIAASLCSTVLAQVEPTPTPEPTLAPAPIPAPADGANDASLSHHDRGFLKKAAKGGMKEVAVSQAVMDQLTNPQVRAFAQQMITDHTAANNELASLSASKGVQLPPQDPDLVTDWSKKTDGMDKKYVKEMVADHLDAVKLFQKAAESGNADIAAFAQKTLPTLQHHLMMAQDLKKTID
jgi:putative membrane protein